MSCIALLTVPCPGPEHHYRGNLYVPHLATLSQKISTADEEKASDPIKNMAMIALKKGYFCFQDTCSVRLSMSLGMHLCVCWGLSGTSGWTSCGGRFANCKHSAPGFPSYPNSSRKIPKWGLPGKTALQAHLLKASSFNPVTKSYTNSVLSVSNHAGFLEKQACLSTGTFVPMVWNVQDTFS